MRGASERRGAATLARRPEAAPDKRSADDWIHAATGTIGRGCRRAEIVGGDATP